LCNSVKIHFINASSNKTDKSTDVYTVKDLNISETDENTVVFSWLISGAATKYAGSLSFCIEFACINENGVYLYRRHTEIFKGVTVSDGINCSDTIETDYSDILSEWEARLKELEENGGSGGDGGRSARISEVTLTSDGWQGEVSPYSQVVNIEGITPYSQVDLTPDIEQLSIFYQKDLAFVTENENGIVTVFALGDKPQNDYTIQVTITEVSV
jgi:hypothetical protein